jgi:hypothetical protein
MERPSGCPECDRYLWKIEKRRYCSPGCAEAVHKKQIRRTEARIAEINR